MSEGSPVRATYTPANSPCLPHSTSRSSMICKAQSSQKTSRQLGEYSAHLADDIHRSLACLNMVQLSIGTLDFLQNCKQLKAVNDQSVLKSKTNQTKSSSSQGVKQSGTRTSFTSSSSCKTCSLSIFARTSTLSGSGTG